MHQPGASGECARPKTLPWQLRYSKLSAIIFRDEGSLLSLSSPKPRSRAALTLGKGIRNNTLLFKEITGEGGRQCMITLWLHPQHSRCQLRPLLSPKYQMDRLPSLQLGAAADAVWKEPVRANLSLSIFCLHRSRRSAPWQCQCSWQSPLSIR